MINIIGVIALIFFTLSVIGGVNLYNRKEYDRSFKEELLGVMYLYITYLCFH